MRFREKIRALTEEDARRVEFDVSGVSVPLTFSGAKQVKRTPFGWKTPCERCGGLIKFDRNTIETAGPANKPNLLKEVTVSYKIVKETNNLADDVEKGRLDWIRYLRRHRTIIYDSSRFATALAGNMTIKLECDHCGSESRLNVDIGGDIKELKELPTDVEALIQLGITKEDSKQFFQLRTGELADKFVEAIKFSQEEISQLEEYRAKIEEFVNNLPTESNIVAELLYDVNSAARTSVITKIKQLEEWQQAQVAQVYKRMFPYPKGG